MVVMEVFVSAELVLFKPRHKPLVKTLPITRAVTLSLLFTRREDGNNNNHTCFWCIGFTANAVVVVFS